MLNFQGSPGAVFNCLGKLGLVVKQIASYQSAQKTNYIDPTNGVYGQLNAEPDIQAVIGDNYMSDLSGPEVSGSTMQNIAQLFINRKVFEDNPQPNQSLTQLNVSASIAELIRQMRQNGQTVQRLTIGATVNGNFTNVAATPGNAVVVVSVNRPSDGLLLENSFAETVQITCTQDSYSGGQAAFNEAFSITGEANQPDPFAYNWPLGSGGSLSVNSIDGDTSDGSGNLLTNSGFSTFTSNVPNNWALAVGTAGVNVFQETGLVFSGAGALKLVGDAGGTLTSLTQQFGSTTGTAGTLSLATQYSVCLWLRGGASPPAAGVLQVDLCDQFGNVILDEAGAANSFQIDLTKLTNQYQPYTGVFRTPVVMPSQAFFRLHLTTAVTNGAPVYVDKVSLGEMSQLYTSGPYFSVHAGSVPSVQGDYVSASITNSRGAGGTLSTFQTLCSQLLSLQQSDILIPSSSVPTISDALIA